MRPFGASRRTGRTDSEAIDTRAIWRWLVGSSPTRSSCCSLGLPSSRSFSVTQLTRGSSLQFRSPPPPSDLGFERPTLVMLLALAGVLGGYVVATEAAKRIFYRRITRSPSDPSSSRSGGLRHIAPRPQR